MNRTIRLLTFAAAILTIASCDVLDSPGAPAEAYFPLAIGNEWTYAVSGEYAGVPHQETWNIAEREGEWYRISQRRDFQILEPPPAYLRLDEGALIEGNPEYANRFTILPSNPHTGASWENGWGGLLGYFPVFADKMSVFRYDIVDADADVSVPAGSFTSVLLVRVREVSSLDPGTRYRWYAPGVGLVKEEWRSPEGKPLLTRELMTYSVRPLEN